jgi:hypothetical protein
MPAFSTYLPPSIPTEVASPPQQTQEPEVTLPAAPTLTPELSAAITEPAAISIPTLSPISGAASTAEPTSLPTAQPFVPDYTVQAGTPITTTNFLHPEEDCAWAGLSGQVFGSDGSPVTGLVIEVRGEVDDQAVQALGMTGAVANLGVGGYEVKIKDSPVQVGGELQAQVFKDGQPLSEPASFSLMQGCDFTLVLLNFVAVATTPEKGFLYFPAVLNGKADVP